MVSVQEHEVFPLPNASVLAEVAGADAIIYAMGSLYTSICPSLVLQVRILRGRSTLNPASDRLIASVDWLLPQSRYPPVLCRALGRPLRSRP